MKCALFTSRHSVSTHLTHSKRKFTRFDFRSTFLRIAFDGLLPLADSVPLEENLRCRENGASACAVLVSDGCLVLAVVEWCARESGVPGGVPEDGRGQEGLPLSHLQDRGARYLRCAIVPTSCLVQDNEVIIEKAATDDDIAAKGDPYNDNSKAAFEEFVDELKTVCARHWHLFVEFTLSVADR